jgi:hypothetical protein
MKIHSVFLKLLHTDIFGNVHERIFATFTCKQTYKDLYLFLSGYLPFMKLAATDILHITISSNLPHVLNIEWHVQDAMT